MTKRKHTTVPRRNSKLFLTSTFSFRFPLLKSLFLSLKLRNRYTTDFVITWTMNHYVRDGAHGAKRSIPFFEGVIFSRLEILTDELISSEARR